MSDRFNAFLVILDADVRDDDAEPTLAALRQIKGVLSVEARTVEPGDVIAYERARREIAQRLFDALNRR